MLLRVHLYQVYRRRDTKFNGYKRRELRYAMENGGDVSRQDARIRTFRGNRVAITSVDQANSTSGRTARDDRLPLRFLPRDLVNVPERIRVTSTYVLFRDFRGKDVHLLLSSTRRNGVAFRQYRQRSVRVVIRCDRYQATRLNDRRLHFLHVSTVTRSTSPGLQLTISRAGRVLMRRCLTTLNVGFILARLSQLRYVCRLLRHVLHVRLCRRRVVSHRRHFNDCLQGNERPLRIRNVNGRRPFGTRFVLRRPNRRVPQRKEEDRPIQIRHLRLRVTCRSAPRSNACRFLRKVGFRAIRTYAIMIRNEGHLVEVRVHVTVPKRVLTGKGCTPTFRPATMYRRLFHRPLQILTGKTCICRQIRQVHVSVHVKYGVSICPRFTRLTNRLASVFFGRTVILSASRNNVAKVIQDTFRPR